MSLREETMAERRLKVLQEAERSGETTKTITWYL